jgi:hypothetical protein
VEEGKTHTHAHARTPVFAERTANGYSIERQRGQVFHALLPEKDEKDKSRERERERERETEREREKEREKERERGIQRERERQRERDRGNETFNDEFVKLHFFGKVNVQCLRPCIGNTHTAEITTAQTWKVFWRNRNQSAFLTEERCWDI